MWKWFGAFALVASPAAADLTVSDCRQLSDRLAECKVTNEGDRAVSDIEFAIRVTEDGRTFPWAVGSGSAQIAGGLEPGEGVSIRMSFEQLPDRAAGRELRLDGEARPAGEASSGGPPMTAGEKSSLSAAVQACWNIGSLSSEAQRVTITTATEIGPNGKPVAGSIKLIKASSGSEDAIAQAFEAARRAILRCAGADGYDLPPEKIGHWSVIEIVFNPNGARVK
ncbi:hypothetical protein [Frigidibacter sp. MR17.24]|uniref:hypothetical protein n=1 Tax=Frigidibacter sp. MR17.24 TaxID=3127345 RepID=UPI003012BA8D